MRREQIRRRRGDVVLDRCGGWTRETVRLVSEVIFASRVDRRDKKNGKKKEERQN